MMFAPIIIRDVKLIATVPIDAVEKMKPAELGRALFGTCASSDWTLEETLTNELRCETRVYPSLGAKINEQCERIKRRQRQRQQ